MKTIKILSPFIGLTAGSLFGSLISILYLRLFPVEPYGYLSKRAKECLTIMYFTCLCGIFGFGFGVGYLTFK